MRKKSINWHNLRKIILPVIYLKKYRIKNINNKWFESKSKPKNNKSILVICGFGSFAYKKAAERLAIQARELNQFTKILIYTDFSKVDNISIEQKNTIERLAKEYKRGWGLWSWKPSIVSAVMRDEPDGAEIFYIDAGCEISKIGQEVFNSWRCLLQKFHYLFFTIPYLEREWTTSLVLNHFGLPNNLKCNQIQATWFAVVNTEKTRSLINNWAEECLNDNGKLLIENNEPKNKYLIEHREDQSILSCLIRSKYKIKLFKHRDHFAPELYYKNSIVLKMPIHSLRLKDELSFINPLLEKSHNIKTIKKGSFRFFLIKINSSIRLIREFLGCLIRIKKTLIY